VYISVSRAAVMLLAVFALIYVGLVQKGSQKVTTTVFIVVAIFVTSAMFASQFEQFNARFSSEIQVLESADSPEPAVTDDRVSFGRYEGLGSNRVRLWAVALDRVLQRSTAEIVFGSFFESSPSHSDYFDVLTRNGFVGLFVYVLMLLLFWKSTLFLVIRRGISNDEKVIHALAFTLITLYIIYAFPFRPLSYTTTAWFMWAMIGFSFARAKLSALEASQKAKTARAQRSVQSSSERGHVARRR
jgi:O-antigen ligase